MGVLVGCSGWSYDDWIERFYPASLANRRSEWLGYYGQFFSTVEINSTFYRVPSAEIVKTWIEKGSKMQSFEFSIKVPEIVTHEDMIRESPEKTAEHAASFEQLCIKPLAEAGLLGSALIQLSPYFAFNDDSALKRLRTLFGMLKSDDFRYAVEFRHRSWVNDHATDLKSDVLALLTEFKIANVIVDGPALPITRSLTAKHAYVRFHGRNYDLWFKKSSEREEQLESDERREDAQRDEKGIEGDDYRINRYDYLYSNEQLSIWKPRIEEFSQNADKVRVYFNNHGRAKAVKNALFMMDLLGIPHEEKAIEIQDQKKIGEFT